MYKSNQRDRVAIIVATIILSLLSIIVVAAQDNELPTEVIIEHPGLAPEGIEWDALNERFIVGSMTEGTVFTVNDDGKITPFIESDRFISTLGLEIDLANERLLVVNSDSSAFFDPSLQGLAALGAYDLTTGEEIFYTELNDLNNSEDARFLANDVAVDTDGNAYVTNSFAPEIYVVDPDGNTSVLISDERLISDFLGLNGIVYHKDGYLLVTVTGGAELYKIPVDAPENMTQVEVDVPFGADGMMLLEDGRLIAVADYFDIEADEMVSAVIAVDSEDGWETATLLEVVPDDGIATTAAVRQETVYIINAYLNDLEAAQYEIERVDFSGTD